MASNSRTFLFSDAARREYFFVAIAIAPVLLTAYQTMTLYDVTGDIFRKAIQADTYTMTWVTVWTAESMLFGLIGGLVFSARIGSRNTIIAGLALFALGSLLSGMATDLTTLTIGRIVLNFGKGMVIAFTRSLLYSQFGRALMVAVAYYAVVCYATRPATPLITAYVNEYLGWRWIHWVDIPLCMLGMALTWRYIRKDPPPPKRDASAPKPDGVIFLLLGLWAAIAILLVNWQRKWGATSNEFVLFASLSTILPIIILWRFGRGASVAERLRRLSRVRTYLLSFGVRVVLLLHLSGVLGLLAAFLTDLHEYPRATAGLIMAAATPGMAISSILCAVFQTRRTRQLWLVSGVVTSTLATWLLAGANDFTSKEHLMLLVFVWGLAVGLLPMPMLLNEVEGLASRDKPYAVTVALAIFFVPLLTLPTMASVWTADWRARAQDAQRMTVVDDRPEFANISTRIADYYQRVGIQGEEVSDLTGEMVATRVEIDSVVIGYQQAMRMVALMIGGIGIVLGLMLRTPYQEQPSTRLILPQT